MFEFYPYNVHIRNTALVKPFRHETTPKIYAIVPTERHKTKEIAVRVTLKNDTRMFSRLGETKLLHRTGEHLQAGTEISLGTQETMTYDHRDQLAAPFALNGKVLWVLVDEAGLRMAN